MLQQLLAAEEALLRDLEAQQQPVQHPPARRTS
jgi:hypothetical protein